MIKLIVVRHGETIENTQGVCQGQTDGTLSERGFENNKLMAKELSVHQINKIYSSPLKRAADTAKEILKYHSIELEFKNNLMEWYLGTLQGEKFPDDFDITNLGDDMENAELVKKRLLYFLEEIRDQHKDETIVIVSHGLTIKVLTTILKKLPITKAAEVKLIKNSGYELFII